MCYSAICNLPVISRDAANTAWFVNIQSECFHKLLKNVKRALIAIAAGIILTILLTAIGLSQNSREALCVFVWQACLVQLIVHTPDNPIHEASPIDLFGFALGVLLGIPIYSVISYTALRVYSRISKGRSLK